MAIKKFDGINVIPFVDIMLVLLAIVLTTSTLVEKNLIPVSLPKSSSKSKVDHESIVITVKKNGEIFYKQSPISLEALKDKISTLPLNSIININCDKNSKFENFVTVLDILKQREFKNISIITKADD